MDTATSLARTSSTLSQSPAQSQTAADYISTQLSLEADAREALPYQFDTCTYPLGPLRQSIYACLTCTPPPASKYQQHTPAGICYSCSISCHGEHNLVELFTKRDFVCDCGTTRFGTSGTPCQLRHNAETGRKGGVQGELARQGNRYNQNFEGKFCGCGEEYDPELEKGTMFQCLGLGTVEDGGCGEDWWHPECLLGLERRKPKVEAKAALETVREEGEGEDEDGEPEEQQEDSDLPDGFPDEDDFEHLICYKCVNAFPWIKAYAGSQGFLVAKQPAPPSNAHAAYHPTGETTSSLKRKAEEELEDSQELKRTKSDPAELGASNGDANPSVVQQPDGKSERATPIPAPTCSILTDPATASTQPKHATLPSAPSLPFPTLFLQSSFRDTLCRCPSCFPHLKPHPQLLEEEDSYEPPVSESDAQSAAGRSINSGSLLERGEAVLSSMDRVKAIEGVMAYNHVRDKVKEFLRPFAEKGEAVGAEDVKEYFARLRGDEMRQRQAMVDAEGGGGVGGDGRREQGGY